VAGRRKGGADTRAEILVAARAEFSDKGYDAVSLRGVARAAGVDPALVHHYFTGGKEELFAAAMEFPVDPSVVLPRFLAGDLDTVGERLVRVIMEVWGSPAARMPILAVVRSAMTHERAATMLRGFVTKAIVGRIAARLDTPDAMVRANLMASQLVGLAMLRYVIRVEPLASLSEDEVVALIAPTIQRYATGVLTTAELRITS